MTLILQDSDRLWRLTPPAQRGLSALLDDSSAAMSFSWSVLRNAPPLSPHGSPMCQATQTFPLAPQSRSHLVDILEVCVINILCTAVCFDKAACWLLDGFTKMPDGMLLTMTCTQHSIQLQNDCCKWYSTSNCGAEQKQLKAMNLSVLCSLPIAGNQVT